MASTVGTDVQQRSALRDHSGGDVPRGGVVVGFDGSPAALEALTWVAAVTTAS